MLKIAVCDDSEIDVKILEVLLREYFKDEELEVKGYTNGLDMVMELNRLSKEDMFDIIVSDICFVAGDNEINAVDLLSPIQLGHPDLKIIYITGYQLFVRRVANALPFGYIEKPFSKEQLYIVLDRYRKIEKSKAAAVPMYIYKHKGAIFPIPYDKIKYVYSTQRIIIIVCSDDSELELRSRIDELWQHDFSKIEYFSRPNKGYIVNLHFVEKFSKRQIEIDGISLNIRPRYIEDFRKRTNQYFDQST